MGAGETTQKIFYLVSLQDSRDDCISSVDHLQNGGGRIKSADKVSFFIYTVYESDRHDMKFGG